MSFIGILTRTGVIWKLWKLKSLIFKYSAQHGVRGNRALGVTAPLSLDGPTDKDEILTTDLHGKF